MKTKDAKKRKKKVPKKALSLRKERCKGLWEGKREDPMERFSVRKRI